jgi:uncharacterized repeat protein (TIGR02543 family)
MPDTDVVINAAFDIIRYTVTFDPDGGLTSAAAVTADYNTTVGAALPTASKTRYSFDSWRTTQGGPTVFDGATFVTDNITVYAKWSP